MANSVMLKVNPSFDLEAFSNQLADAYRAKGFAVNVTTFDGSSIITFDKNTGGINMLLGMGEGIKATCTMNNDSLTINFSDGDWTGKIIGLAVGWIVCFVPFITAIVGCVKQTSLPKSIANDATVLAANFR